MLSVRCLENLPLHLRSLLYQKNGYSVHYQSSLIFNLQLALFIFDPAPRIQLSLFRRYLGFSQRKSQRSRLGHAVRVSSHFLNEYQKLSYQFIRLYLLLNLNAQLKPLEINQKTQFELLLFQNRFNHGHGLPVWLVRSKVASHSCI